VYSPIARPLLSEVLHGSVIGERPGAVIMMQTPAPTTGAPVESVAVAVMRNDFGDLLRKIVPGLTTSVTRPTEALVVISTLVREELPTPSVAVTEITLIPLRNEMLMEYCPLLFATPLDEIPEVSFRT
jgi:hypothetical protein